MPEDEFGFDPSLFSEEVDIFDSARNALDLRLANKKELRDEGKKIAVIRTSDRINYRRCRRKWNWSHSSRGNLQSSSSSAPLWLGTGLHFCFEDFHGYRHFPHPRDALTAYLRACEKANSPLPDELEDLMHLGREMMDYYELWLENRDPLKTLVVNGEPQVEVNFHVEIPKEDLSPFITSSSAHRIMDELDQILYSITIDRVTIDPFGRLWAIEYKSAKRYEWFHLDTDPQVSAYAWGMHLKYPDYEIAGTVYQQHKKQVLAPPKFLSSTKMFSTSKRQKTSLALYVGQLRNLYGPNESSWPEENRRFVEFLKTQESDEGDELIKRDFPERSPAQIQAEYKKMLPEIAEMLDPNIPLYPNPTRDCSWQCSFTVPCVGIDSGEDWEHQLSLNTMSRTAPETYWRDYLRT